MKIILSAFLTLSLLTGGAAWAGDKQPSEGKSTSTGSKKHSSGSHRNNRTGSHKTKGNVPSGKN